MRNAMLDEAQTGIKTAGRNINNLRYADDTTLMAASKEELKSLLMKVKEDRENSRRKSQHSNSEDYGIQSHQFMANRLTMETVTDFYFLGLQNHCGWWHEIKRHLLLGRKAITNLDSILRSRNITLLTKVHLIKAMVFPVVMYGCESWTIKKAELQRIDNFKLWCWKILLRIPWKEIKPVNPKGNQSWIFIGRTDAEAKALILWPPESKNWLIEKDPAAGERLKARGEEGDRRWDGWMASPTWWTWVWASSKSWWWTGKPGVLQSMGLQRVGHNWATELS